MLNASVTTGSRRTEKRSKKTHIVPLTAPSYAKSAQTCVFGFTMYVTHCQRFRDTHLSGTPMDGRRGLSLLPRASTHARIPLGVRDTRAPTPQPRPARPLLPREAPAERPRGTFPRQTPCLSFAHGARLSRKRDIPRASSFGATSAPRHGRRRRRERSDTGGVREDARCRDGAGRPRALLGGDRLRQGRDPSDGSRRSGSLGHDPRGDGPRVPPAARRTLGVRLELLARPAADARGPRGRIRERRYRRPAMDAGATRRRARRPLVSNIRTQPRRTRGGRRKRRIRICICRRRRARRRGLPLRGADERRRAARYLRHHRPERSNVRLRRDGAPTRQSPPLSSPRRRSPSGGRD